MSAPKEAEGLDALEEVAKMLRSGNVNMNALAWTIEQSVAALRAVPDSQKGKKAGDVGDAWAKQAAADTLRALAESEPEDLTIQAQDLLADTPVEHLYCVEGEVIERFIYGRLSDAFFDGEIMLEPTASPQSVEGAAERPDYADDLALAIWCELPRDARIDSVLHMIADKIRPHVAALRSRIEGAAREPASQIGSSVSTEATRETSNPADAGHSGRVSPIAGGAAVPEPEKLLADLVAAIDRCQPGIDGAFMLAHVHGGNYNGLTYSQELQRAREYLALHPSAEKVKGK